MSVVNNRSHTVTLACITGICGFFLGGLAVYHAQTTHTREAVVLEAVPSPVPSAMERVYASKKGKKFYPWWCSAGASIAKKNIIWFENSQSAIAAGYTATSQCGE